MRHDEWSEGIVQRYEGDKVVVLFETVGSKSLVAEYARKNRLMQSA